MTAADDYIVEQVRPLLQPGEQIEQMAYVSEAPATWLVGPLLNGLLRKAFFVALTDRRLLLIKTRVGAFHALCENHGVETIDRGQIEIVKGRGTWLKLFLTDGKKRVFKAWPPIAAVTGTAAFFEAVPSLFPSA